MNPFELRGGAFLLFYVIFGCFVVWGLRRWIRALESKDDGTRQNLTDPYLIAYLRDGETEALKVATVALLDRGLLASDGATLTTQGADAVERAKRPIEKAILAHYATAGDSQSIFNDAAAKTACESYRKVLVNEGLLAGPGSWSRRFVPVAAALGVLVGSTVFKVQLAFSQGRHNVGFLIALTIFFGIVVLWQWGRRRTGAGDTMLDDLKQLFKRLKSRAKTMRAGGQTNEAALLAAVFGLTALPVAAFPFMEKLFPVRSSTDSHGCSSSSSSSCSSGSSCGGGCGGGGCGG